MKRCALVLLVAACAPRLTAYVVKQGYDKRDFRPLGLWPQDPDWRTSAN
jgi:hypothetical protein